MKAEFTIYVAYEVDNTEIAYAEVEGLINEIKDKNNPKLVRIDRSPVVHTYGGAP